MAFEYIFRTLRNCSFLDRDGLFRCVRDLFAAARVAAVRVALAVSGSTTQQRAVILDIDVGCDDMWHVFVTFSLLFILIVTYKKLINRSQMSKDLKWLLWEVGTVLSFGSYLLFSGYLVFVEIVFVCFYTQLGFYLCCV